MFKHQPLLAVLALTLFAAACSDGGSDEVGDNTEAKRFVSSTENEEVVLTDTETGLTWVNGLAEGSTKSQTGCNPLPSGLPAEAAKTEAEFFCDQLEFSGYSDWRVATPEEHQVYLVALDKAGIIPFYQNPSCPRVVGIEAQTGTLKTVNTHNTPPIGQINDWNMSNAGVRCVRS